MKVLRLFFVVIFAAVLAAGCNHSTGDGTLSNSMRVGMVVDVGGLNDYSFNESANKGLVKAMQDFSCDVRVIESKSEADYEANIRKLADARYDLVIAVGVLLSEPLIKVAKDKPNVKFVIIDGNVPDMPNVSVYRFREEEGAFLVGALSTMVSSRKKLGFVGGMDIPLIEKFEAGFKAGVKTISPEAEVFSGYTGSFNNPESGRKMADKLFDKGADIVFHASGGCGNGVIDAAQERGAIQLPTTSGFLPPNVKINSTDRKGTYFAVGVDSDQDSLAPGRVLTSMIKGVDVAVYESIKSMKENRFKAGTTSLGIKEGAISLSPMRYTKEYIRTLNSDILPSIDRLSKMITDGQIQVPDTLDKLKDFKPPTDI
ncbi:MAG: BMP family ABC transporter substrate-binding protein [Firmicutes bacterium]|nr:BMP family ABC transporter substrate-binding protein [Bacillota bacterium]